MSNDEILHTPLSERYKEALLLAATWHRGQSRKGTEIPYLSHLLMVSALVLEYGGDEEQAIAALLHDAVEDQGLEKEVEIRARFGDAVGDIVMGCTDSLAPKGATKAPWRARKEAYLAHLADTPDAVKLVSAADKLHNARAIVSDYRELGEALWSRFNGGRDGTLWYYRGLVTALHKNPPSGPLLKLVQELTRVVSDLERLAGVDASLF